MALKDAGVTRAKVGPDYLEVDFAPELEEVSATPATPIAPPNPQPRVATPPMPRAGYHALFPTPPSFTPVDE